jgi:7-carboxy-7-deazaguanine synthase
MSVEISEIFGPTLQGEGHHIGHPTVFVRIAGCDYRCQWCLTGDTVISLTSGNYKQLKDIEVGDNLESFDEENKSSAETTVVAKSSRIENNLWVIYCRPNFWKTEITLRVACSKDHQWLTTNGWKKTEDIKPNDEIYTNYSFQDDKPFKVVTDCRPLSEEERIKYDIDNTVYDIKCDPYPTFYANQILSHNCDTLYAVDPKFKDSWISMEPEEIMDVIKKLTNNVPMLVTFSGGNPAIYDLSKIIQIGKKEGYTFTIETQGSIPCSWFNDLDYITFSPKPPSSGMKTNWDKLTRSVDYVEDKNKVSIKVVVQTEEDYQYALDVFSRFPNIEKYITPCNETPGQPNFDAMFKKMREITERVLADKRYDIRILPQLHVLLWGNERGK